jgi:DNA polymerase
MEPRDERAPGATFALGDVGFVDFESRSSVPIAAGSDRYARSAQALLLSWAIGDGPVSVWSVPDWGEGEIAPTLRWHNAPMELLRFLDRVDRAEAVLCAHNATFDRTIWNHSTYGFPHLEPWMIIDSKAQAMASGLPAALEGAARSVGSSVQKDKIGKAMIELFTLPDSIATPLTHPDEWQWFKDYAADDVAAMREVFLRTRQLPLAEWREYWAAERINDLGVAIDIDLVAAAARMALEDQRLMGWELGRLTGGVVTTVNQTARMIAWLGQLLPADGREMLVKREEEVDIETGEVVRPAKGSLTRDRLVRLVAYLESLEPLPAPLQAALRVLQIRRYGGSKTPAKFARMMDTQVGGVLRGQYVFNGAAQTGRFSSKGVQVHNLARDPLDYEIDAIDALVAGTNAADFARLGDDTPISRKLSLLIRPCLVPELPHHVFVWGDWSNIEARLVPWLSDDEEAEERLDIFRAVDDGTEKYDIYTRTAARLSGLPLEQVDKPIRQRGKVVELACGFGGGTNALLSMAASYGIHLETDVAKAFVEQWRNENQWAVRFWGKHDPVSSFGLWGALNTAMENPGHLYEVGRVAYIYLTNYLGGSLLCRLPSGRCLTYRRIRWEYVDILDDDGALVEVRRELMFSRNEGRVKLWPGLACENIVQGTAADLMRGTLLQLDEDGQYDVRLHTHDEILVELPEAAAAVAGRYLREVMEAGFTWSTDLPIAADTVVGRWYTKSKGSIGL